MGISILVLALMWAFIVATVAATVAAVAKAKTPWLEGHTPRLGGVLAPVVKAALVAVVVIALEEEEAGVLLGSFFAQLEGWAKKAGMEEELEKERQRREAEEAKELARREAEEAKERQRREAEEEAQLRAKQEKAVKELPQPKAKPKAKPKKAWDDMTHWEKSKRSAEGNPQLIEAIDELIGLGFNELEDAKEWRRKAAEGTSDEVDEALSLLPEVRAAVRRCNALMRGKRYFAHSWELLKAIRTSLHFFERELGENPNARRELQVKYGAEEYLPLVAGKPWGTKYQGLIKAAVAAFKKGEAPEAILDGLEGEPRASALGAMASVVGGFRPDRLAQDELQYSKAWLRSKLAPEGTLREILHKVRSWERWADRRDVRKYGYPNAHHREVALGVAHHPNTPTDLRREALAFLRRYS